MTSFPSTIPLPFIDYSGGVRNATIKSNEDHGYLYRRARRNTAYADLSVVWVLTPRQYALFRTFYDTTLSNGATQFEIELRYPKNTELTEWVVRFQAGFDATYQEGIWNLSAGMEIFRPATPVAVADSVGFQGFQVVFDSDEHQPFHVEGDHPYHVQL